MPSNRHIELQNMVQRWIRNRSFKLCGLPESNVVGYLADFVAIAGMQTAHHTRYADYSGLEKKYMSWQYKTNKQEVFGDVDRWYVCVFEVKVSRSDFLNTFGGKNTPHAKARMEPVGTAHWVVAEKGVCEPEELPDFWGLLIPYGAGLSERKIPKLQILPEEKLHAMAFDMLWLTMNHRWSFYNHLTEMARMIAKIHKAIINNKSTKELLLIADEAKKMCRGLG